MKAGPLLYVLVGVTLLLTVYQVTVGSHSVGGADDGQFAAIEKRLERLEDVVRETRDDARRAARAGGEARRTAVQSDALVAATAADDMSEIHGASVSPESLGQLQDAVAERVERALDRRAAEERNRGWDGKWKPPIDEVTKSLELDDAQEAALRVTFDAARDELLTLLQAPRADGGTIIDDFTQDIFVSGDGGEAFKRFLGKLTTAMVPGDDQTYLAALTEASERIRASAEARLDEKQRTRFRSLQIDVFDVKTGYDPVGDYVRQRLEQLAGQ